MREPRIVPRPRNLCGDNAVFLAPHPRRRRLDEHPQRPQIQATPSSETAPFVVWLGLFPADSAPSARPFVASGADDEAILFAVIVDFYVFDHNFLDTEQRLD
jgi:hypothetical protein